MKRKHSLIPFLIEVVAFRRQDSEPAPIYRRFTIQDSLAFLLHGISLRSIGILNLALANAWCSRRMGITRNGRLNCFLLLLGVLVLSTSHTLLYAGQPLETETSRLLKARQFEVENTFERQLSSEGTETSVPMAVEYGITDNLELLAEPVFYTAIRPKVGSQATGLGDVEVTLSYLFLHERSMFPALTTAAEVKIPTANDILISTKKTDYTGYLIASKRLGKFDTHANIGYTIIGKPAGVQLSNIFSFALAEEYHLNERFDIVGEILGNTSSSPEGSENAVAPEAAGGELVGMLGVRYRIQPHLLLALGVSYDNNNAVLIRPGLTFGFK